jgi:hypothetical protein
MVRVVSLTSADATIAGNSAPSASGTGPDDQAAFGCMHVCEGPWFDSESQRATINGNLAGD